MAWIVRKEEEGREKNGFVPDSARIRLLKHETGPQKQYAKIYYSKLVWKDGITEREAGPPVKIRL